MRRWLAAVILMAAVAGCSESDDAGAPASSAAATSVPSPTEPTDSTDSTVALTDAPSTSTGAVPGPLPVFDEIHDRAGSAWRVEVLGVVEGITNPRADPRARTLPPCLAIVLHATFLGPEQLGAAENLSFGSADGGSVPWGCLPAGWSSEYGQTLLAGTSVIAVVGMLDFEEPLPDTVELFARDRVTDTTEYFTATVGPMPELPAAEAGPTPSPIGDAATPLIHAVADGTVTATVAGAWLTPTDGGMCAQVAATFVVSEDVNAITVSAQDLPMLIAGGMVQPMVDCGAPADGYVIDPDLFTYVPGVVYGMSWSYLVPAGSELQALVLPGGYTDLIGITLLDGPPPPP
ncbi:MAG: hypothetical protein ABMA25_18170 [Ilumatobacteraceae bacterium]